MTKMLGEDYQDEPLCDCDEEKDERNPDHGGDDDRDFEAENDLNWLMTSPDRRE
jgi:hypothetical protein